MAFEYEADFDDFAWPWAGHKQFAYDLVSELHPRCIVELGTHRGTSFFSFCQAVKDRNIQSQLHAVDTWHGEVHAGQYGDDVFEGVAAIKEKYYAALDIHLLRKDFDSAIVDFPDDSISILHIDGLHTYDAVKHDYQTWYPKVAKDGVILLHDIFIPEGPMHSDFGVYRFWNELRTSEWTIEFQHSFGLGVLVKNKENIPRFLTDERALQMKYVTWHEDTRTSRIFQLVNRLNEINDSLTDARTRLAIIQSSFFWKVASAFGVLLSRMGLFSQLKRFVLDRYWRRTKKSEGELKE